VASYLLSPEAREDLRYIRAYLLGKGGKRLARHVFQEVGAVFRLLASRPEAGHLREDLTPLPVKSWSVFSYLIVYDPATRPIAIVVVLYGTRNLQDILSRGTE
jgi:antitoxin ParD1/3/4/toxin ParE1/3/4